MNNNEKGLTFIEVVLSLAIFSVLSLILYQAFSMGSKSLDTTSAQSRVNGETRVGMERITKELRSARYSDATVVQSDQLQFKVPQSISPEGDITWSGWIQYELGGIDGEQLLREDVSSGDTTVLANRVSSLQFVKNSNPDTVTINLTALDSTSYGNSAQVSLTGTVEFRN